MKLATVAARAMRHLTRFTPIISIVTYMLILPTTTLGAETGCSSQEAAQAESEAATRANWQQVFDFYQRFRRCDDAAISEANSSAITRAVLVVVSGDRGGKRKFRLLQQP